MAITEDDQVFALLDRAVAAGPNTVFQISGTDASADRGNFVDLFRTLSSRQLPLGAYVMHPWRYGDVLSWGSADLDQVSLNVIVKIRRHVPARARRKLTKFGGSLTARKGTRQYRAKSGNGKV